MPRPTTSIATLRRILQQELLSGKILVALAEESSVIIIAGDASKLPAIEERQRKVLEQQRHQETARIAATRNLAWGLGLERVPPLSELLKALTPHDAETLAQLRSNLLETQSQLERLNARNRLLLDNMLEYVRFSLEVLTSAALQPARYGTNLTQVAAPSFYIDSKA
jgi:hypothetical protein